MTVRSLGDLADPTKFHEPIDIEGQNPAVLRSQLRMMATIRMVEQKLALMRKDGVIGGPVHLGVGQEAVAVGVSESLRSSDRVFGAHRSHSHVLALGSSLHGLFAEVLGKDTGLARGMGGSMHLWDHSRGFYGSVPIVGGAVPLAVGAAFAAKHTGTDDIAVTYFGDGAVEEGAVQESFNLARMLKAPVLFVVENNFFSSHMHIRLRQPHDATARFAEAHDIPFEIVDGNDVVAVHTAAERLVTRSRRGEGPGFLEAVTFRWYGHVDWREDIDVGIARSPDDLANWRARDPISRLTAAMEAANIWSQTDHKELITELENEIASAWQQAMDDPWPEPGSLLDRVYAQPTVPDHVFAVGAS
jgi:TPP-dependent pyruvate/acetoin dehydrogenase alpha subunit